MDEQPRKPTIEERLEAVTQTLELLASISKDNEERHRREMAEINAAIAENTAAIAKNRADIATDGEHIRALVRIAEIHEHRLSAIEPPLGA